MRSAESSTACCTPFQIGDCRNKSPFSELPGLYGGGHGRDHGGGKERGCRRKWQRVRRRSTRRAPVAISRGAALTRRLSPRLRSPIGRSLPCARLSRANVYLCSGSRRSDWRGGATLWIRCHRLRCNVVLGCGVWVQGRTNFHDRGERILPHQHEGIRRRQHIAMRGSAHTRQLKCPVDFGRRSLGDFAAPKSIDGLSANKI